METQSRTQYLIPGYKFMLNFINNINNCFGLKLEPNGQFMVKIVLYGGIVLVRSDTVIVADRNLDRTVRDNYGRYRDYGPKSNITA